MLGYLGTFWIQKNIHTHTHMLTHTFACALTHTFVRSIVEEMCVADPVV